MACSRCRENTVDRGLCPSCVDSVKELTKSQSLIRISEAASEIYFRKQLILTTFISLALALLTYFYIKSTLNFVNGRILFGFCTIIFQTVFFIITYILAFLDLLGESSILAIIYANIPPSGFFFLEKFSETGRKIFIINNVLMIIILTTSIYFLKANHTELIHMIDSVLGQGFSYKLINNYFEPIMSPWEVLPRN